MSGLLSTAAWAAHDLGTAVGVGGTLFGRVAMEPSVRKIEDRRRRAEVVMDAWRRFGAVQMGGLVVMAATWYAGRARLDGRAVGGRGVRGLVLAKDILVGATVASAIGAAVTGNVMGTRVQKEEVPFDENGEVAADAPPAARRLGRATDTFGLVNLLAGMGVIAVTSVLAMQSGKSTRWSFLSRLLP